MAAVMPGDAFDAVDAKERELANVLVELRDIPGS